LELFACAPVNLGLTEHLQYFVWILNRYVASQSITNEPIESDSDDIDYLETAIKCVELYQWLARHFDNKNFLFSEIDLLENKSLAVEGLNNLLSEKISVKCSSCGAKLPDSNSFNICENCFGQRRRRRGPSHKATDAKKVGGGFRRNKKAKANNSNSSSGSGPKSGGRGPNKSGKKRIKKSKASAFTKG
jgi:ATP-dependent RNA helicase SUPV3L1/SUV3